MVRVTRPHLPSTPAELKAWRAACAGVTQRRLAKELGISGRSVAGYETDEFPVPPLLPWALVGLFKPLRSKLRAEARRARANQARRHERAEARRVREAAEVAEREVREETHARRRAITLLGRGLSRKSGLRPDEIHELGELRQQAGP